MTPFWDNLSGNLVNDLIEGLVLVAGGAVYGILRARKDLAKGRIESSPPAPTPDMRADRLWRTVQRLDAFLIARDATKEWWEFDHDGRRVLDEISTRLSGDVGRQLGEWVRAEAEQQKSNAAPALAAEPEEKHDGQIQ